jgi:hypothetical protein
MKKLTGLIIVVALILLSSCNPKVITSISHSYPALDYKQEVMVLGLTQLEPEKAEVLGLVRIGDTGFTTNCSYDIVVESAKLEARKAGGNMIKITDHTLPSVLGSSCHQITARILKVT